MMRLTMRYGFPTYVEDSDADRQPKNETLAEHKLHCKAKPDNCPFEKRAAKKAEEEDEAGDPREELKVNEAKKILKKKGYEIFAEDVHPIDNLDVGIPLIARYGNSIAFIRLEHQDENPPYHDKHGFDYGDYDFVNVYEDIIGEPEKGSEYLSHWKKVKEEAERTEDEEMGRKAENRLFIECVKRWLKDSSHKGEYYTILINVSESSSKTMWESTSCRWWGCA